MSQVLSTLKLKPDEPLKAFILWNVLCFWVRAALPVTRQLCCPVTVVCVNHFFPPATPIKHQTRNRSCGTSPHSPYSLRRW